MYFGYSLYIDEQPYKIPSPNKAAYTVHLLSNHDAIVLRRGGCGWAWKRIGAVDAPSLVKRSRTPDESRVVTNPKNVGWKSHDKYRGTLVCAAVLMGWRLANQTKPDEFGV